jgi:hypothetical protein
MFFVDFGESGLGYGFGGDLRFWAGFRSILGGFWGWLDVVFEIVAF